MSAGFAAVPVLCSACPAVSAFRELAPNIREENNEKTERKINKTRTFRNRCTSVVINYPRRRIWNLASSSILGVSTAASDDLCHGPEPIDLSTASRNTSLCGSNLSGRETTRPIIVPQQKCASFRLAELASSGPEGLLLFEFGHSSWGIQPQIQGVFLVPKCLLPEHAEF